MRTITLCVGLGALLLGGCATWGQFDKGMNALQGRPLDDAINVFGMPSGERTISGRRYIQWGRSSSGFVPVTTPSTTYGNVNVGRAYGNYSSTTYSTSYVPVNYNCSVTMEVDENDRIMRGQYEGNLGGCEGYIKRLNRFRKQIGAR